ncbi:MAG: phytanoyl-CoA dioxygenase family protein [Pseudomonadota bacterium]|jgi:hypothetical protein|nr:phytanoyl-CoA dioxygenase family protein [Pseudomonadota bacterium]
MPQALSNEAIHSYRDRGYHFPYRVLGADEARSCRASIENHELAQGEPLIGKYRYKVHLLFTWARDLIRHHRILDAVESLIGPNILVWTTNIYLKEPHDGRYISWHQDKAHWGLDIDDIVTVWVALSPATLRNGCMQFMPGTHHGEVIAHADTWEENNILTRGQTIQSPIDPAMAVQVELEPGEASFHHVKLWHGSDPNQSDDRRVSIAIRYIPTRTRQRYVAKDFATLVRGEDMFSHFVHEPSPERDMEPDFVRLHDEITAAQQRILYHGTAKTAYGA